MYDTVDIPQGQERQVLDDQEWRIALDRYGPHEREELEWD